MLSFVVWKGSEEIFAQLSHSLLIDDMILFQSKKKYSYTLPMGTSKGFGRFEGKNTRWLDSRVSS